MTEQRSTKIAIVLWSLVFILSFVSLTLLGLDSYAKSATRNPKYAGKTVLTLNTRNTVSIRGSVTRESMNIASSELLAKSRRLPIHAVIYVVLDTPGGDVDAGNSFLDLAESIPQRVDTISVYSASMGFHIAQKLGTRYITPSGKMMSHRLGIRGLSGQVPGEAETRLKEIKALSERMDLMCANRMGLGLDEYRHLIRDEYYVAGERAVEDNAADKVAYVTCDSSFKGFNEITVNTIFGPQKALMNKCPLISGLTPL